MAYKSEIDGFDVERGDVVSLAREDIMRLFMAGLEIGGPILWAFFDWFLNKNNVAMNDIRDNMVLEGLKEHQRGNAARRYEYLCKQYKRRTGKDKAANEHGQPWSTTDNHGQPRTQVEVEEEVKEKRSISEASLQASDSVAASLAIAAHGDSLEGRQRQAQSMNMDRPIKIAASYDEYDGFRYTFETTESELRCNPIDTIIKATIINDEPEENTAEYRNGLRKALKTIGPDAFFDVALRFMTEWSDAETSRAVADRKLELAEIDYANSHGLDYCSDVDAMQGKCGRELQELAKNVDTLQNKCCTFGGKRFFGMIKEKKLALGINK